MLNGLNLNTFLSGSITDKTLKVYTPNRKNYQLIKLADEKTFQNLRFFFYPFNPSKDDKQKFIFLHRRRAAAHRFTLYTDEAFGHSTAFYLVNTDGTVNYRCFLPFKEWVHYWKNAVDDTCKEILSVPDFDAIDEILAKLKLDFVDMVENINQRTKEILVTANEEERFMKFLDKHLPLVESERIKLLWEVL